MESASQVPEAILKLVEKYEFHQAAYKRGQFNETQLRREFIDPFFKTLGWDVDNTQGNSELYKEVIHEDPIRIRGSTEFIDYAFRIGGSRKFIVEAKKPAVNIKDDSGPALQIRRYAWNARLPLSILTDFEEFAVYDCTKKPMPGDNAATARIAYFTFKEYPEKWSWIESIFSQKSILRGSFDKFVEGTKGKKGTATVDEAILAEIEEWRDLLAKNIAIRNTTLSVEELNVAVQKTIDRILFLRICEDRGIEEYGCLQKLLEGQDVYQRLLSQFHRADTRYNSGLFHFNAEAGWDEMPDTLTPGISIDDVVLKKIVKRLYYPESPYEFSVISPVILGQVYEQFLGKVIRLTAGHQAKVEYKPEVKKAGGVYYTPQYIVDYIVQHTVGELVKDKTPREAAKLRILDPACGSGSFLLGAYQFLLDWHLNWYIHNLVPVMAEKSATSPEVQALLPEPAPKMGRKRSGGDTTLPIYKASNGKSSRTRSDWNLTTSERKRILLNNIYGVDIDTQAVEVTKLSLLLKVLEEESEENVSKQLKLFDERALPSLHQNIKCGNSLIGTDIYADVQVTFEDPEVAKRINAFDWDREFTEIMQKGGFDAVIGNPPYGAILSNVEISYLSKRTEVFTKISDTYIAFIELSYRLRKDGALFGYIIPSSWLGGPRYRFLREFILRESIETVISLPFDVFKNAYIDTMLLTTRKETAAENHKVVVYNYPKKERVSDIQINSLPVVNIPQSEWRKNEDNKFILDFGILILLNSIRKRRETLFKASIKIKRGVLFDPNLLTNDKTSENCYPYFEGDVYRYSINFSAPNWIEYGPRMKEYPKEFTWFEGDRLLLRRLVSRKNRLMASYINQTVVTNKNLYSIKATNAESIQYILGLVNSKLISRTYLGQVSQATKDDFPQVTIRDLLDLPYRTINFSDPTDKARHDKMVALVERMLALHKQKADVKTDHEKNLIERQIEATDKQIDALVYELYGLTEEEIGIVEGEGK